MITTLSNRISIPDQKDIDCLVCCYPNMPLDFYIVKIKNEIKNITPYHYMYLGWVIGVTEATEETLSEIFNNQNHNSLCRAN